MQTKVLKFGGSSLASAAQFRKVADIVRSDPQRRYVVASAPGKRFSDDVKVTDLLSECYQLAAEKQDISEKFARIVARYNEILQELGLDFSLNEEFQKIRSALQNHVGMDYVASRGEYLNAKILAHYLGFAFVDAEDGIFFRDDGTFDDTRSYKALGALLSGVDHAVVPGFYGSMPNGTIRTFSRGGSDITGSIVSRAVKADIYENWTDVSGMLMSDPRIIENPRVIREITYKELRELAYMGATVMHDEAIFPVREARIPINIRNTNAPEEPGTMIVPSSSFVPKDTVITGVAGRTGFSSISIEKDRMNLEIGFGRKVLSALENFNLSFEHLPTGIDTMSVVVQTSTIADCREALIARIYRDANADNISIEDGISLIAVVGRGMVSSKGTALRVLDAIASHDINIRMIDQGSDESNIIIGVNDEDYANTMKAIYHEFVEEA